MAFNSLILDTYQLVLELRYRTAHIGKVEGKHFIVDILGDTIDCLQFARQAFMELHQFTRQIADGRYEYGYSYVDPSIARLVFEIGESCFHQLYRCQAYLPDGRLPFFYHGVQNPQFNDVLLIRANNELT